MRTLMMIVAVGIVAGCANMPVIGPCSYTTSELTAPKPGTSAGNESIGAILSKGLVNIAGYAGDVLLYSAAVKALRDDNEKANPPAPVINTYGDTYSIDVTGDRNSVRFQSDDNAGE